MGDYDEDDYSKDYDYDCNANSDDYYSFEVEDDFFSNDHDLLSDLDGEIDNISDLISSTLPTEDNQDYVDRLHDELEVLLLQYRSFNVRQ